MKKSPVLLKSSGVAISTFEFLELKHEGTVVITKTVLHIKYDSIEELNDILKNQACQHYQRIIDRD